MTFPTRTLGAILLLSTASPIFAQEAVDPMLDQGTQELGLSGTLEFPEFDELDFNVDATYGYFIRDGWEVGGRVLGADIGGVERFDVSIFTEYNFDRGGNVVPYVGTSFGLASINFEDPGGFDVGSTLLDDDESTVFTVAGGIKWFVRDYMAVSTSIDFTVSGDDIFPSGDELEDSLTRFKLGLRYYY